jgi:V/A-type H+-transporting ATPase subunit E
MDAKLTSHGIEDLIARLHGDGVEAGRREATRILQEAQMQAAAILARARSEADQLKETARASAATEQEAARHALRLAFRDTVLALKEELCVHLAGRLRRMVAGIVCDPLLLRQVVVAAAGQQNAVDPEDVDRLLAGAGAAMLREGVGLGAAAGVRIVLSGQDVVIEVSDETLAALLAERLAPRFLARLDGAAHD